LLNAVAVVPLTVIREASVGIWGFLPVPADRRRGGYRVHFAQGETSERIGGEVLLNAFST